MISGLLVTPLGREEENALSRKTVGAPRIVNEYLDLLANLKGLLTGGPRWLVGIDGALGSRKTTVATQVSKDLGATQVNFDNCLNPDAPSYVDRVASGTCPQVLEEARRASDKVIVDGVCLMAVLERLTVRPTVVVYMQRMSKTSMPAECGLFDDEVSEENLLRSLGGGRSAGAALDREIAAYHKRRHPERVADLVYQWVET